MLVRIAVARDHIFKTTPEGRVMIGEEMLHSQECARKGCIDSGDMFNGMPIFRVMDKRTSRHPACAVQWRQCDWLTRSLLCDIIDLCRQEASSLLTVQEIFQSCSALEALLDEQPHMCARIRSCLENRIRLSR